MNKLLRKPDLQLFAEDACPPKGSRYAPMTAWGFFGTFLLMNIPVVGTILTIVWALGGVHNVNRRAYARGMLLVWLVSFLLILALYYLLVSMGYSPETIVSQLPTV